MNLYFVKPNFASSLVPCNIEFPLNLGKCSRSNYTLLNQIKLQELRVTLISQEVMNVKFE